MTVFSENLRRFRTARHLTQEQVAVTLNTSPQSISHRKTGAILHIYAGNLCWASKQYSEAFAHWEWALELEPQWMDAAYAMAECHEALGEYAQTTQVYSRIADDWERRGFEAEVN